MNHRLGKHIEDCDNVTFLSVLAATFLPEISVAIVGISFNKLALIAAA